MGSAFLKAKKKILQCPNTRPGQTSKTLNQTDFEELAGMLEVHSIRVPDQQTVVTGKFSGLWLTVVFDHVRNEGYIVPGNSPSSSE